MNSIVESAEKIGGSPAGPTLTAGATGKCQKKASDGKMSAFHEMNSRLGTYFLIAGRYS
jgi:hypothetical protein